MTKAEGPMDMTGLPSEQSRSDASQQERYTHGYDSTFVAYLQGRTIARDAAFFVTHLRSGMSLLDCGCGPGAITIGLAEFVAPGQVVGVDIAANQIDLAREDALTRGISNIRFEVGNIYELHFPDHSFDAAFAHTVLQHLSDPVKVLKEIYRVLKPDGVVGLREEDTGGIVFAPSNDALDQSWELYIKTWRYNGGDPYFARRHRAVLREAGFARIKASATCEHYGTPEATRSFGESMAPYMASSLETAVRLGWVDAASVERMSAAWRAWGNHPDAFLAILRCEAIGWKE
jgi:ubiquinone/menaquinone biosynthesis C-methylase UbiE